MPLTWRGSEAKRRLRERLVEGLAEAGEILAAEARLEAPVKTGQLRDSIGVRDVDQDRLSVDVTVTAPHSRHVEFGTRKTTANPFVRRAIARAKGRIRAALQKSLISGGD